MFLAFIRTIVSIINAHYLCKLSKMVSLRYLSVADRKLVEVANLQKLRRGENTRNVAKDLQVCQSWVAHSFGGKSVV
jgi:hypothetical protein